MVYSITYLPILIFVSRGIFKCNLFWSIVLNLFQSVYLLLRLGGGCLSKILEFSVIKIGDARLLKYFCDDCSSGLLQVLKISKAIDDLNAELSLLKTRLKSTNLESENPVSNEEGLISELYDRFFRSNNLMIFNMSETGNDLGAVNTLFRKLTSDPIPVQKAFRIGRGTKNGSWTLKVVLLSQFVVHSVLRQRSKLKGTNIFMKSDLTPMQLAFKKKVMDEFKRRKFSGDNGICLRYI